MLATIIITYNPDIGKVNSLIQSIVLNKDSCVIVVDNKSLNIKDFSNLFTIENVVHSVFLEDNLGIAFAQNMGIKKAIELGASHILFFDQDSKISNNFVEDLISDYEKISVENTKIAAIGPRFIDENKGFYFPALRFNKYGLIDKISVEDIKVPTEVSFLISSGTLVSVDSLKSIGFMKEEFFIDFVDTEWCFRALSMGYKIYMSEKAIMKHSIGDDTLKIFNFNIPVHSGFRRYYRIRNLFFMWKMPYIPKVLVAKLMVTNFVIQILLFLLKDKKLDYIKFYLKAIKDGVKQSKDYRV
ncbi:glycosyltransferase family 2 protein [Acinetobacter ursingii]|uniref:glycosyltransferase family 2 protein n=1 Tax=Acinetobacter ursingii TaxID=108980 RepID=UPI00244B608F|nr:glycosyltransferase family 2 protein [Acinetobacter ursingii]MDG9860089.1 glycosyltransferase family 2 protein [Acinetobacter ursingii]MDG9893812.1 glycosyltransferase family 2 protein [Acinetobacter ursingii]MDH0007340.1 glycosyltransferase family 2 protein [Acinetobacter ursingii]MDH0479119.1 glycosyltransferase family 2 protein [Acinetobacter ursingii]MDH2119827.1 glycosyltransferase family 2 protein [Acinetobacter ursingii]